MYQTIENSGKRWMTKSPSGEVFTVVHFRVTNGSVYEPVIFQDGKFKVCPDWEIIDSERVAEKARALFVRYLPEFEKTTTNH